MQRVSLIAILIICFVKIQFTLEENVIQFDPPSLVVELGSIKNVSIKLNQVFSKKITVNFTYGDENTVNTNTHIIEELTSVSFEPFDNSSKLVELKTKNVGHVVIGAQSNDTPIPLDNILRLDVIHSSLVDVIVNIVGWIYFVAWSISFYPQVILNWRTKDVSGLSFDFIGLNLLGFICYTVFNTALYWSPVTQHEYMKKHPRGVLPVLLNDVLFALHAVLLTMVTIIQCLVYRKPRHNPSKISMAILALFILFLLVSGIVYSVSDSLSNLDYIYFFSYVKLAITIMKYCPQAYFNYKRKSTVGWSIHNILLDFTGGSFSLLQMFLLAYNYNDYIQYLDRQQNWAWVYCQYFSI